MNIAEALKREHSKRNTEAIVRYIGHDASLFSELVDVFKGGDLRMIQRASWPLSYVVAQAPALVHRHLGTLLALLDEPMHAAYKRNVFRLLRVMDEIPEKHHATVIEHCMQAMADMKEPAAVRAFAIHIMGRLLRIYPELSGELQAAAEPLAQHELPSIRSSAAHLLKQIHKSHQ